MQNSPTETKTLSPVKQTSNESISAKSQNTDETSILQDRIQQLSLHIDSLERTNEHLIEQNDRKAKYIGLMKNTIKAQKKSIQKLTHENDKNERKNQTDMAYMKCELLKQRVEHKKNMQEMQTKFETAQTKYQIAKNILSNILRQKEEILLQKEESILDLNKQIKNYKKRVEDLESQINNGMQAISVSSVPLNTINTMEPSQLNNSGNATANLFMPIEQNVTDIGNYHMPAIYVQPLETMYHANYSSQPIAQVHDINSTIRSIPMYPQPTYNIENPQINYQLSYPVTMNPLHTVYAPTEHMHVPQIYSQSYQEGVNVQSNNAFHALPLSTNINPEMQYYQLQPNSMFLPVNTQNAAYNINPQEQNLSYTEYHNPNQRDISQSNPIGELPPTQPNLYNFATANNVTANSSHKDVSTSTESAYHGLPLNQNYNASQSQSITSDLSRQNVTTHRNQKFTSRQQMKKNSKDNSKSYSGNL